MNMFFVCGMSVDREQYNVKYYGKHEILLLDTWLLYIYYPPDWVGQYLVTYNKNVTYIYSALDHNVQSYRDTLLPWPCMQWNYKYDSHEVVLHSYRFQKYDWIFHQTFCFAHCDFYL